MRWLRPKVIAPALFMSVVAVSEALAGAGLGAGAGFGTGGGGTDGGGAFGSAPEIDGPAGVAAIALLVSAGLIAYNRFRQK
jgi:hypothetical protein